MEFKTSEDFFIYLSSKSPKFKESLENHITVINNLGKELAAEKLTRLKNEGIISALGKELAQTKLNNMNGGI